MQHWKIHGKMKSIPSVYQFYTSGPNDSHFASIMEVKLTRLTKLQTKVMELKICLHHIFDKLQNTLVPNDSNQDETCHATSN